MKSYKKSNKSNENIALKILYIMFFPLAMLYYELVLRAFDGKFTQFFSLDLLPIILFALAEGLFVSLVLNLIPAKKVSRIIGVVLLSLTVVIFCIERGCRTLFGLYFGAGTVGAMTGDAVGEFGSYVWSGFLKIIPFFLLSLVPLAVFIIFQKKIIGEKSDKIVYISTGAGTVVCHAAAVLLAVFGSAGNYFTHDFTASNAIPHFGLMPTLRMDIEYSIIGVPEAELGNFIEDNSTDGNSSVPEENSQNSDSQNNSETPEPPKVYGFNTMDIDFDALAAGTDDKTLKSMHEYFGSLTPSQQNEYTGMFKDKNLIFLTAEAFSPYFISKELTPALYRLTHEGFVFNNYYQPDWTMSTVGGETANLTGIIPSWINGNWSSVAAAKDYMPFTLGNQFSALGYSVPAWHNHTYSYYDRDKYLKSFGFDYKGGRGGGLELPISGDMWPESDLEMIQATADSYINDYVNNGKKFCAYYMTVSGHTEYNFGGNDMAIRNKAAAQAAYPNASTAVQAYVACNLELEYALEYLMDKLEASGIADDTLIVMSADHYPFGLVSETEDYYNELRGFEDTEFVTSRYKNALIMWSGCIEEPIVVDTPCSSIDILPTLSNLFGLEYDSRLMIGRDIFAANYEPTKYSSCMPLVIFANNHGQGNSWITEAGVYEASTKTFTPNKGVTVSSDYVSRVNRFVQGKINYSKQILANDYYRVLFG